MQIRIDSFAAAISDPATGLTLNPVERMHHLLEEIELADKVGLYVFGIGEHHRAEFLGSAPVVILSAAATRTENIRLTSAVTVLSAWAALYSHALPQGEERFRPSQVGASFFRVSAFELELETNTAGGAGG